MAVRQLAQGRAIRDQQARGAALGEDQREHLPVGPRAPREPARAVGIREQRVHLREVGAVPGPESVAEPAQLAEARARGERDAVQVVEHDALSRRGGVRPVEIGAQRRRPDLAQLVGAAGGVAARRVEVLLELRRERAAARQALALRARRELRERGGREAIPFDHRVAGARARGEQLAVLDEEQGLQHQRRNAGEVPVDPRRVARVRQRAAGVVLDREAGAHLLVVDRRQSPAHQLAHARRRARLELHLEAVALELRDEARQLGVAEALVVGSARREPDRGALARLQPEGDLARDVADEHRLELRAAQLEQREPARRAARAAARGEAARAAAPIAPWPVGRGRWSSAWHSDSRGTLETEVPTRESDDPAGR